MRTTQRARGGSSDKICALYFNPFNTLNPWRSTRRYLPQVKLESHTTLTSVCYTTTLKQVFSNSSKEAISQACYTFPLYDGVAVSGYTITYGDTILRGVVQQKDTARQTYEGAVDRGETAGLLESLPAGIFGVTIGNLPPHTDVHVDIVYCGELKHDAAIDGLRFMLPTSIAPRYGDYPGELMESTAVSDGGISIVVDVDMGKSAIRKCQSPSHPISVSMGATSSGDLEDPHAAFMPSKASAGLTLGTTELADDFVLQLLIDDISRPQALVEKHKDLSTRAIMATLVPKFNLETSHPEIVFIADQSGSMQGPKNAALVSALTVFIKSLPLGVRFNIVAFGNHHKSLWPKSQAYNEANMKAAIEFVGTFRAEYGGTELLHPVEAAFENRLGDMPLEVMLLTDGEIWGEQTLFDYINTQIFGKGADARVFALGIGNDVSHTLVEGVARAGNGFAQFVTQEEGTDQKVVRMLKGALYPHLTNRGIEVRYANDNNKSEAAKKDDFELVEKVDYCLNMKETHVDQSVSSGNTTDKAITTEKTATEKIMSFFDTSTDLDKPIQPAGVDRYSHLPTFDTPKILQAPSEVPFLFPFNRTTIYLILGPDAPEERVSSITLRATSPQGPLELTIEVTESEVSGTTVHQLAARKAIQELEEGRGWLQSAKTATGTLVREEHESRLDELVEREAVRLGESYQVAGKWTSFVAVQADGSRKSEDQSTQPFPPAPPTVRCQLASRSAPAPLPSMQPQMTGFSKAPTMNAYQQPQMTGFYPAPAMNVYQQQPQMTGFNPAPAVNAYQMPAGGFGAATFGSATLESATSGSATFGLAAGAPKKRKMAMRHAPAVQQQTFEAQAPPSLGVPAPSSDSDDEMGFGLFDSEDPPKPAPPANPLHRLIGLQTFSGAWDWNEDLFAVLMQGKKPEFDAMFGSDQVMATALAVAYMESQLLDSKDVWEMIVSKAKTWMGTQMGSDAVEGLIEKAKGLL